MAELLGKTVLVTGAEGFIGSHIVEHLVSRGAQVRAMVQYNGFGSRGWLDAIVEDRLRNLEVVFGDIRDTEFVRDSVRGVNAVLHLAALIGIPYSYRAVQSYVDTNITGTLNVLLASQAASVGRTVVTSTSEVYGTPLTVPITEAHPLKPQSPYAATKVAADALAHSFVCSFGMDIVIVRPFNTYGPRQSLRAVIPTILSQMLAGRRSLSLGSLETKRDFTYVSDTAEAFLRVLTAPSISPGQVIQFGSGVSVSIGDVVELCSKLTGWSGTVEVDVNRIRPDASEVRELLADPSVARNLTGWHPEVDLESGLESTAKWMSEQSSYLGNTGYVL